MIDFNKHSIKMLETLLRKHFPKKRELSIGGYEEITGGWETTIFSLHLNSQVAGAPSMDDLILRFFPGMNGAAQAQKEFNVMQRLHSFDLPIPKVEMIVVDRSPFGEPFIVMEKIIGHTLASKLTGSSEEKILPWVRSSASLLHQLHQIAWQEVIRDDRAIQTIGNNPLAYVNSKLAAMRATIESYQLIEFERLLDWLEERLEYGASTEFSLLHNDYHPQNLMLSPNEDQLTILDWSFVEVGDFRLELAWSVLLFGVMFGEQYRLPLMDFYEEFSGRPINHFKYFEVLKLTDRMLTIATWLDDSVTIPIQKITKEAIRGDYKIHVLNVYQRLYQILGYALPTIENL